MKKLTLILIVLICAQSSFAEVDPSFLDKLRKDYRTAKKDNKKVAGKVLIRVLRLTSDEELKEGNSLASLRYRQEAFRIARKINPSIIKQLANEVRLAARRNRLKRKADFLKSKINEQRSSLDDCVTLVEIYLLKWDSPSLAKKYTNKIPDDNHMKKIIRYLNKPLNKLTEEEVATISQFYDSKADEEKSPFKEILLRKAKYYGEHYLAISKTIDEKELLTVKHYLRNINKKLGVDVQKNNTKKENRHDPQPSFDALSFLNIKDHVSKGKFERQDKNTVQMSLNPNENWARANLPISVTGDYVIESNITIHNGICKIYFPVGKKQLALAFAKKAGAAYCVINGKEWLDDDNDTRIHYSVLDANYNAEIKIVVKKYKDDKYFVHSTINGHDLKVVLEEEEITGYKDKRGDVSIWGYKPVIFFHKLKIKPKNGKVNLK